ncbi:hypothetical protein GGR57DRAFT_464782 [Xylariaceae sp. FL1272]|nr:hypothetical protein GGR57DRAFT_464782 [Xylariaceae sp. FL1272]
MPPTRHQRSGLASGSSKQAVTFLTAPGTFDWVRLREMNDAFINAYDHGEGPADNRVFPVPYSEDLMQDRLVTVDVPANIKDAQECDREPDSVVHQPAMMITSAYIRNHLQNPYNLASFQQFIDKPLRWFMDVRDSRGNGSSVQLNISSHTNAIAAYATMAGDVMFGTHACVSCQRRNGPFRFCVVLEGALTGSCSNCYYNNRGFQCSFRPQKGSQPAKTLAKQPRTSIALDDGDSDSDFDFKPAATRGSRKRKRDAFQSSSSTLTPGISPTIANSTISNWPTSSAVFAPGQRQPVTNTQPARTAPPSSSIADSSASGGRLPSSLGSAPRASDPLNIFRFAGLNSRMEAVSRAAGLSAQLRLCADDIASIDEFMGQTGDFDLATSNRLQRSMMSASLRKAATYIEEWGDGL